MNKKTKKRAHSPARGEEEDEDFVMTIDDGDEVENGGKGDNGITSDDEDDFGGLQFDADSFKAASAGHAWDFTKALKQARTDGMENQTTVDHKIQQLLQRKKNLGDEDEEDDDELIDEQVSSMGGKPRGKKRKDADNAKKEKVVPFSSLGLSRPILRAIDNLGYTSATPIQAQAIPPAMQGKDIMASALTGSGKTAAFVLPILERLSLRDKRVAATRVVILTPTRELALQCHSVIEKLGEFTGVRVCLVVGGLSSKIQGEQLSTNPDIIVATPGRLIDHLLNTTGVGLNDMEILVLDEADRLLDMGFTKEIEQILEHCPTPRQTMLFSATLTQEVKDLARLSLSADPVRVVVDTVYDTASTLVQEFIRLPKGRRSVVDPPAMLLALCSRSIGPGTIVFFRKKQDAHQMRIIFGLCGLKVAELHGNMTQSNRILSLQNFRDGNVDFLMATDVAARGLDIIGVETVINFDMPPTLRQYVHRVGRTARAGNRGKAVSFVGDDDKTLLKQIVKHASEKAKNRVISEEVVAKFREKLVELDQQVKQILEVESQEREMRMAQMQADKAQNIIEHQEEIYNRPKKEWFLSEKSKLKIKRAANRHEGDDTIEDLNARWKKEKKRDPNDPYRGMSRKKRRRQMHFDEVERDKKRSRREGNQPEERLSIRSGKRQGREVADNSNKPGQAKKKPQRTLPSGATEFEKKMKKLEKDAAKKVAKLNKSKGATRFKSKARYKRK